MACREAPNNFTVTHPTIGLRPVHYPALKSMVSDPMFRRRATGWIRRKLGLHGRTSFAQAGEDLLLRNLFDFLRVPNPSYLDIGANHPVRLSNSYLFYREGSKGVLIEPDPRLASHLTRARPRDVVLNVGIGRTSGVLDFYVMATPALNTFSREEADHLVSLGHKVVEVLQVPVVPVEEALAQCGQTPDFLNVDAEGMDMEIVSSIDFVRTRPASICVETITYSESGEGQKRTEILDYLIRQDYFVYADTYINSIFVDRERWNARRAKQ